jgi:hypothetical protein
MTATARRQGGGIDHRVLVTTMAVIRAAAATALTDREHP